MKLRIGTRTSRLAMAQAEWVKHSLAPHFTCQLCPMESKGDQILDRALHKVGDKGLFTAELEKALLNGEIDLAVHSLKDLPTKNNPELPILAISQREDPRDCVIFSHQSGAIKSIFDLPPSSIIGSSSLRRIAQLQAFREDFQFIHLRGNVNTRLQKIKEGQNGLSAGILAVAGLNRLKMPLEIAQILTYEQMLPAPGQGALAIQGHVGCKSNAELMRAISLLHDDLTAKLVGAERAALHAVDGGCQTPFGAHAQLLSGNPSFISLQGIIGRQNSSQVFRDHETGPLDDYEGIGLRLGQRLKAQLQSFG